jgi:hypothetical protein
MVKKESQAMWEKKCLGILSDMMVVGVLIGTLWPFDPFPSNRVAWLAEANGIRFGDPGVVISNVPLVAGNNGACTLELLLRPSEITREYTIATFYDTDSPEKFQVKQWTDGLLVVRNALDARRKVRKRKFDLDHAFQRDQLVLLTMASGINGTVVYLNGLLVKELPRFTVTEHDLSGQIVLGTAANDYDPWPGEIRGLAVYSKELTREEILQHYESWTVRGEPLKRDGAIALYRFNERAGQQIHNAVSSGTDLEIPIRFNLPYKLMLASPVEEFGANWEYVKDVLLNIAGFVPLGFLICAFLGMTRSRKSAIMCTVLFGGALSFVIEVLQFYIPRRVSGTTDIITNTLGAALGAVLARPNLVRIVLRGINSVAWREKPLLPAR